MAEALLLAYNMDPSTTASLQSLCSRLGLRYRAVNPWEYGQPIGALAGLPVKASSANAPASPFGDPMLVMCHMLSPQLDAFLSGMREDNIPRVALKAVLTPVNVLWNSFRLRDELAHEHEAICQGTSKRN